MIVPYVVGEEYNRRGDLHDKFGGNRPGGMCKCADHPVMFLFTGDSGEQHGYTDGFTEDGKFLYSGEGQVGDMTFTRGNLALRDHIKDERHVLLFMQTRKGFCQFLGEFSYIDHQIVVRRDREGNDRKAILFELAFEPLGVARQLMSTRFEDDSLATLPKSLSIEQLRELAVSGGTSTRPTRTIKARQYYRSEAVRRYALRRAQGICECCDSPAPFFTKKHEPYLEVHHLNRVSDGGADTPEGVAAICPTCHRNIHAGISGSEVNSRLKKIISEKEESLSPA